MQCANAPIDETDDFLIGADYLPALAHTLDAPNANKVARPKFAFKLDTVCATEMKIRAS
jgi:hypothetical protein